MEVVPLTAARAIEALIKRLRFMPERLSFMVDVFRPTGYTLILQAAGALTATLRPSHIVIYAPGELCSGRLSAARIILGIEAVKTAHSRQKSLKNQSETQTFTLCVKFISH